jgi:hypothetical protein
MQETVLACARFLLIVTRPDLHIATVLHSRSLPAVVAQVPIINFCEQIMSITSIIICVLSLVAVVPRSAVFGCEARPLPSLPPTRPYSLAQRVPELQGLKS